MAVLLMWILEAEHNRLGCPEALGRLGLPWKTELQVITSHTLYILCFESFIAIGRTNKVIRGQLEPYTAIHIQTPVGTCHHGFTDS